MPDSSLPLIIYFFFYYHSCSARRSRMKAGVFLFCYDVLMLNEYIKKRIEDTSRPRLTGSKRTTFRGAKRRCKSEWDAKWLAQKSRRKGQEQKYRNGSYKKAVPACRGKCQPIGWRKGQVWADTDKRFVQNGLNIFLRIRESGCPWEKSNNSKIFREHIKNITNRQKEKSIADCDSKRLEKIKTGTDIFGKKEL